MTFSLIQAVTGPLPGQTPALSYYAVAAPGAGAEWSVTVPAGQTWLVQAARAVFVTSATVANRVPNLVGNVGGSIVWQAIVTSTQPASSVFGYSWFVGASLGSAGIHAESGLPSIFMPPASTISTITDSLDAGDSWGAVTLIAYVYS